MRFSLASAHLCDSKDNNDVGEKIWQPALSDKGTYSIGTYSYEGIFIAFFRFLPHIMDIIYRRCEAFCVLMDAGVCALQQAPYDLQQGPSDHTLWNCT